MGRKGRNDGIFDRGIGHTWAFDCSARRCIREPRAYPRYKMNRHMPVGEIKNARSAPVRAVTVRERLLKAPNTTASALDEARGRLEWRIAVVGVAVPSGGGK